jgi:hypothetical protein
MIKDGRACDRKTIAKSSMTAGIYKEKILRSTLKKY